MPPVKMAVSGPCPVSIGVDNFRAGLLLVAAGVRFSAKSWERRALSDEAEETRRLWDQQFVAVHSIHEARVSEEVDVSKYTFVGAAASLAWIITYHDRLPIEGAAFAWFAPFVVTLAGRFRHIGISYQKYLASEYLKDYERKFLPGQGYMVAKAAKDDRTRGWQRATDPNLIWNVALSVMLLVGILGALSAAVDPKGFHSSLWPWIAKVSSCLRTN